MSWECQSLPANQAATMERISAPPGSETLQRRNETSMKARIIGPLATDEAGTRPIRDQVRIVSDGSEFDCRLSVVEIVAQRGNEPPLHRHQHEDLLICILAGQLTIQLDGQRLPAAPGSCVLLPRGSEHGYAIETETARLLLILCLLYTSPSPRDGLLSRMPSSA